MSDFRPIFDPTAAGRLLRVAAFMSGSGTNVLRLLERKRPYYEIVFIFSDRADEKCKGQQIARTYNLPYFAYDIRRFHENLGIRRVVDTPEGMRARQAFDAVAGRLVKAFEADVLALAGYMSFLTLPHGVNVHPADLSLVDEKGRRVFVGDNAVFDAIAAGQKELRSSTLWIDMGVDSGPLLMVSDPLPVKLPAPLADLKKEPQRLQKVADEHQERLKEIGDWVIFPLTMELIGQGRLGLTPRGLATLDGEIYPRGVRPAEL